MSNNSDDVIKKGVLHKFLLSYFMFYKINNLILHQYKNSLKC